MSNPFLKLNGFTQDEAMRLFNLCMYVEKLPPDRFSMLRFTDHYKRMRAEPNYGLGMAPEAERTTCGTCGCFLGHMPDTGIPKFSHEDWSAYAERTLGIWRHDDRWPILFASTWEAIANTTRHAASRGYFILVFGTEPFHTANFYLIHDLIDFYDFDNLRRAAYLAVTKMDADAGQKALIVAQD